MKKKLMKLLYIFIALFVAGVVLQVTVIMAEPLQDVFHTETMSGIQWIITAGLSLMPLLIVELQKLVSGKE